jgi:hypothetical protein
MRLFVTEAKSQLQFFKPKKGTKTQDCATIDILPKNLQYIQKLDKTAKLAPKVTYRKKIHIKSTIEEFVASGQQEHIFKQAHSLSVQYGLEQWFWDRVDKWVEYFLKLRGIQIEKDREPTRNSHIDKHIATTAFEELLAYSQRNGT